MSNLPVRHTPRSILVTGGAGFIGSNYLHHAVHAHPEVQFLNLDLLTYAGHPENVQELSGASNYTFVKGDIADLDLVEGLFAEHGFSTVVNFAAESHVDRSIIDPFAFVRTNVVGTVTLLEASRRAWGKTNDVRFHHVSTDEVFGSLGSEGVFTESTAYDPRSPYAASKAGSDHLVRSYGHTHGLPVVISNASNNYGPLQFPEKLIPLVILNALGSKPIPVYGKGDNVRDWLHVRDHCEAIDHMLRFAVNGETYLVSGGEERTNLDLIHALLDVIDRETGREPGTSRELITYVTDRPGHDFRYALDGSKTSGELGWNPSRTLEQGLTETVRWYLENEAWLSSVTGESYATYYQQQYGSR